MLIAIAWLVCAQRAETQNVAFNEAEVKAVFLFNFAQFVEWPTDAFPDDQSAFVIGVLGIDPFGPALDEAVRGEVVGGRFLIVERFRRVEDVTACHILFVGQVDSKQYAHTFAALRGRPILTVGDTEAFAAGGGIIGFVTARNRIRLTVNVNAAKAANLTISSKLLRAAEITGASSPR